MSEEIDKLNCNMNRRHFLSKTSMGLGAAALASLLSPKVLFGDRSGGLDGVLDSPHIIPKAKRII